MRKNNTKKNDEVIVQSFNAKNRTVSDEHLTAIFAEVGERYGYKKVAAEFVGFADFKIRWRRAPGKIEVEVSDYLDRAPDEALYNLAERMFAGLTGDYTIEFGEDFVRHVTDPKIYKDNQQDYISRSPSFTGNSIGDFHDLNDCVDRLRGQNLIPDDLVCLLTWDRDSYIRAAGHAILQRTVWVNKALDRKGVPEHVLDFCVYHEMCYLIVGFRNGDVEAVAAAARKLQKMHPMYEQSLDWLENEGLEI